MPSSDSSWPATEWPAHDWRNPVKGIENPQVIFDYTLLGLTDAGRLEAP
jgi:hypothetical protein